MSESFYSYQHHRLSVLLGWGLGSVVAGLLGAPSKNAFVRSFSLQAAVWGVIDGAIAFFGRRDGIAPAAPVDPPTAPDPVAEEKAAQNFRRIVAINALLDVGYVVGGALLYSRSANRADRRGMGLGIVVQGVFLLLFDGFLTLEIGQRLKKLYQEG